MAGHADTAEQVGDAAEDREPKDRESDSAESDTAESDIAESRAGAEASAARPTRKRLWRVHTGMSPGTRSAIATSLVIVAAVAGVAGWLGYRAHQSQAAESQRNLFVQVARQAAVNLTTIDYAQVDADIQRILSSATGAFHDDFQSRAQPFIDVVRQVKSKSEGTVAEAGLESEEGDTARVLVAVTVKTSTAATQEEPEPRRWRLRITVAQTAEGAKVSNVEFVS